LAEQSLTARSIIYDLELLVNDKVVTSFNAPVHLTITPSEQGDDALLGIYLYDPLTQQWSYIGGELSDHGHMTTQLQHFSQYALMVSSKTFTDITDHWARLDIESLAAKQIVSGMSAEIFNPHGDVTRAQFAAMIARALKLENEIGRASCRGRMWI